MGEDINLEGDEAEYFYSGADIILDHLEELGYKIDMKSSAKLKKGSAHGIYVANFEGERRFIKIMGFSRAHIEHAKKYRRLIKEFRGISKNDGNCLVQIMDDHKAPVTEKENLKKANEIYTWIVMECGDYNLEQLIQREKVNTKKAIKAVKNTAEALRAVSSKGEGWVHRDIKPANIIVFENYDELETEEEIDNTETVEGKLEDKKKEKKFEDRFKLSDFHTMTGIDKDFEDPSVTISSFTQGTHEYMAPELDLQYESKNPDKEARDIYSIGIVLYQLLTGTTQDDLTKIKPLGQNAKMRYRVLQKNPKRFFAYLGLEPEEKKEDDKEKEEEKKEEFKPVIENVILKEIIKKCLFYDPDPEKQKYVEERIAKKQKIDENKTPWWGRYKNSTELLRDLKVAELSDEYESIINSLNTDINAADAADKRGNVESSWKFVFKSLYGIDNGKYKKTRRGRNWLLDKFEDEVIAKKAEKDREKIYNFYKKVAKPETKKSIKGVAYLKGISLALQRYARIWSSHNSLMQGYKGDVKLIDYSKIDEENPEVDENIPKINVKELNDLAKEYNPDTIIDDICGVEENEFTEAKEGRKIENENIADDTEKELKQIKTQIEDEVSNPDYDDIKEIMTPEELEGIVSGLKSRIQGKLDEISEYREKTEKVCIAARGKYNEAFVPGEFNPAALTDALAVFDGDKDLNGSLQFASVKAELRYLDVIRRKRFVAGTEEEKTALKKEIDKLKDAADAEYAKTGGREYAGAAIAKELAEKDKFGNDDFVELAERKGKEYFEKEDYNNAISCFGQLGSNNLDAIAWKGKSLSGMGDEKEGEEQIEVYRFALECLEYVSSLRSSQEDTQWIASTRKKLEASVNLKKVMELENPDPTKIYNAMRVHADVVGKGEERLQQFVKEFGLEEYDKMARAADGKLGQ
ncbi:hypothetical protein KY343_01415 [Candidatus Woesearchaeota archaeon]|nr:hypothetical protein [Candidatus Woesearchaeota archaeon]